MPDRKICIGWFVTIHSPTHPWLDDLQGYVIDTDSASEDGPIEVYFSQCLCDPYLRSHGNFSMNFLVTEVIAAHEPTERVIKNYRKYNHLSKELSQEKLLQFLMTEQARLRSLLNK